MRDEFWDWAFCVSLVLIGFGAIGFLAEKGAPWYVWCVAIGGGLYYLAAKAMEKDVE